MFFYNGVYAMNFRYSEPHTRKPEDAGFSLVELIVVTLIIATLVAIATPIFLYQRQRARLTTAQHDGAAVAKELSTVWLWCTDLGADVGTRPTGGTTATRNTTNFITTTPATKTIAWSSWYPACNGGGTFQPVETSTGTLVDSSGFTANANKWCIAMKYGAAGDTPTIANTAVYTQDGLQANKTQCSVTGDAS